MQQKDPAAELFSVSHLLSGSGREMLKHEALDDKRANDQERTGEREQDHPQSRACRLLDDRL